MLGSIGKKLGHVFTGKKVQAPNQVASPPESKSLKAPAKTTTPQEQVELTSRSVIPEKPPGPVESKALESKAIHQEVVEREDAAPTTLLSESPPVSQTSEAPPVTETQLVTRGFESYQAADVHFANLQEKMGELPPEDMKSVGKSMFYSIASMTGEFKSTSVDGQTIPMTAGEIRNEVSTWSEKDRKSLEGRVSDFRESHPDSVMLGMAFGAAEWSLEKFSQIQSDEASGKTVPEKEKNLVLDLYSHGSGYSENTGKFADSVNGLNKMGRKDLAQQLVDATVNK